MNEDFQDIDYDIMFSSPEDVEEENFGDTEEKETKKEEIIAPHIPIRESFPLAGSNYLGGECDNYLYRSIFVAKDAELTYQMVTAFLADEGYGNLPLPKDFEELSKFRLPTRNKQILMFEDNGYVHNPIKILFPDTRHKKSTLILEIYNEKDPNHLLKFHRKGGF